MKNLLKAIDATSEWSGKLFSYVLYAGIIVLIYEIVMRYVFNAPTVWAHGVSQRLFSAYYLIGGAYILRYRAHIIMDLIYARFPLRTKAILDVITASVFFAFCGVLLWYGFGFAWRSLSTLEPCGTPFRAPVYPNKLMLPFASFLMLAQGAAKFSRDLITAITGRQCEY